MPNERLRATLTESEYDERSLAGELGLTPRACSGGSRGASPRAASPPTGRRSFSGCRRRGYGPTLRPSGSRLSHAEIVTLYPHRSEVTAPSVAGSARRCRDQGLALCERQLVRGRG